MKWTHNRAVLGMVAVTFLWSTAGVVSRHLEQARAFEVTFWRSFFALLALVVILPRLHRAELHVSGAGRVATSSLWQRIRQGGVYLWASGACWCGMFTFYMLALTMTTVANVLVMLSLSPLMTAIASRLFLGHRIAPRTWLAIAAAGCGIAYMYSDQLGNGISLQGTLVALLVPLSGAANWTITQHVHTVAKTQGRTVDLSPGVVIGAALSCLVTLPMSVPFQASAHDLAMLSGLGLVQLAIPSALVVLCARVLKAPEVSLLALLEVIFGIMLAWLGANEVPTAHVLQGGLVVMGALVANEVLAWRERG